MSTLFIIDQSLTKMGGHHYDYTRLVAEAAAQMGITPVIGANRTLRPDAARQLGSLGQLETVFREPTYTHLSHLPGLRELSKKSDTTIGDQPLRKKKWLQWLHRRAQRKRIHERSRVIRQFAEDCDSFFRRSSFRESDHVFFTTLSELEFMGLAAYLSNHPLTLQVTWHVQFHFSMFSGRPDEYDRQSSEQRTIESCFQTALARIPYHDLHTYTTSEELSAQYNRMKLIAFKSLPYPVNPRLFVGHRELREQRPLRMTVAGGVRREKGQKDRLAPLIDEIWDSQIATGNVQLEVQTGNPSLFTRRSVLGRQRSREVSEKQFGSLVKAHRHPLPEKEYIDLIEKSDIGLFCYDSRRYYARRAGILGEFLAAGIPVIVPAGCWLSRQLHEPICQHIEDLLQWAEDRHLEKLTALDWDHQNVPSSGGIISFDRTRNPFRSKIHRNSINLADVQGVALHFRWQWPSTPGSFMESELTSFNSKGGIIDRDLQMVTTRGNSPESLMFHRIPEGFSEGELVLRNASGESSISIANVSLEFLDFGNRPVPPRSAVGVVAADESSMAAAVDEIVSHYDHYLSTAMNHSTCWNDQHDPFRTVGSLIPETEKLLRAA